MRVLTLAGVLALAPMVTGLPQASTPAKAHPVDSKMRQVGFVKSSVASMRAARGATRSVQSTPGAPDPIATARAGAVTSVQEVAGGVTVVGVTWPKNAVSAGDQFQIRTLTGTTWSQWESFDLDEADGPDAKEAAAAATRGTSPYVVTGASKFEVRSLTTDQSAPAAATVQVVDPGTSNADSIQPTPGAAEAATAKPAIYSRAAWGANESLRREAPSYGQVQLGLVHHTDSSNTYSASQVPAMIRGIYAYHVKGQGWNDIGYNFLVDRFGRTWEGRYGGMDKAVIGAQTMNYNSYSTGISVIGNYEATAVPSAVTAAFRRVFAWKFALSGTPATGTVFARDKYFQRISGHRDGYATSCPGRSLYARIPAIRSGAAAIIGSLPRSNIRRDVDRNGATDVLSYTQTSTVAPITTPVSVLAGARRAPVRPGVTIGSGWNAMRNASLSPDLSGDGKADIVARDPAGNRLRIYLGNGAGGFAGVLYRGTGWNATNRLLAAGDRNADGHNDILATNAKGQLLFYPGYGSARFRAPRVLGTGWNAMSSITTAGDLNGDTRPDLLVTRKSDGVALMYAGGLGGSVRAGVRWGNGWGGFSTVIGGSDLDGDGYPDFYARRGDGMSTYSTGPSGRMARAIRWGANWRSYTQLSTGADWNGDGVADLLAVKPAVRNGALILYTGTGKRDFRTRTAAFPVVAGANHVRLVGDVNGDGYTDAVARVVTDGTLVILLGRAGSGFAAPLSLGAVGAAGWNSYNMIEAAGDYDYDGVPDLFARDSSGRLFLFAFNRNLTFKARKALGGGYGGMLSVVGAGAFNSDANGDVITLRAGDRSLVLFRGNGPNAPADPVVMVRAQNDLAQILGVGDYNGDGRADVLARSEDGRLWLYPGNGLGGIGGRQSVSGGQGVGHILG